MILHPDDFQLSVESQFSIEILTRELANESEESLKRRLLADIQSLMKLDMQFSAAIDTGYFVEDPQLELHKLWGLRQIALEIDNFNQLELIDLIKLAAFQKAVKNQIVKKFLKQKLEP